MPRNSGVRPKVSVTRGAGQRGDRLCRAPSPNVGLALLNVDFFSAREDSGSSAEGGAGLWPATPASLPALNRMAARKPPWPAESPRHAGCRLLFRPRRAVNSWLCFRQRGAARNVLLAPMSWAPAEPETGPAPRSARRRCVWSDRAATARASRASRSSGSCDSPARRRRNRGSQPAYSSLSPGRFRRAGGGAPGSRIHHPLDLAWPGIVISALRGRHTWFCPKTIWLLCWSRFCR